MQKHNQTLLNINILSIARFTAAIIVILFHQKYRFDYLYDLPNFFRAGPQMCTFFFVLSGFVLSISYSDRANISIIKFTIKRLKKIYPIYIIALLIYLPITFVRGNFDIPYLGINVFLTQSWFFPYALTINAPGWFLSNLLFFYITFPFLANNVNTQENINKNLSVSLIIWFMTQILLTFLLNSSFYKGYPSPSHTIIFYFPISHYCSFLLGVFGGYKFKMSNHNYSKPYKFNVLGLVILILIILAINNEKYVVEHLGIRLPFASSLYAPVFLLFIFSLFLMKDIKLKNKTSKFVVYLGALSFPVYILQAPVASYFFNFSRMLKISSVFQIPLYILCLHIVSIITMRIVDYFYKVLPQMKNRLLAQQNA